MLPVCPLSPSFLFFRSIMGASPQTPVLAALVLMWWWIGFVDEHPGGAKMLKRVAGKDASKQFWKYHNEGVLKKYSERLKVGTVGEKAKL